MKLPRRSDEFGNGFDALGVTMIRCANDGSLVAIDELANASVADIMKYEAFIRRIAHLYGTKFGSI